MKNKIIFLVTLFLLGKLFLVLCFAAPMVKAVSQQVLISASIYTCNLTLVVKPEKRLPVNNNWSNTNQIQIEDINTNNIVASFSMNMNNLGIGTINLCANNIFLNEGNYNFYITGFSHLRKKFSNIYSFNIQNITHDLTGTNNFLLAGEISNTFDNKINSLDVSKLIDNMYTNDVKSDLNRDGSVNFLDINIIVTNFLKHGE